MFRIEYENLDSADLVTLSLKIAAGAALVWGASHWMSTRLPSAFALASEVSQEPVQTEIQNPVDWQHDVGKHSYSIHPKADYKIWGLVVERHNSASWLDITHTQVGDFFNTHDLCVIWGDNAHSPFLKEVNFSHGDWTCYFQTHSAQAWKSFRQDQISNNHILPATPEVLDVIRSAQIGDQIEISGQLVDYSTDGNPPRTTSLVRTDTGNGACEIIYAQSARFLARPPLLWRLLEKLSLLTVGAAALLTLFALIVLPYLKRGMIS